MSHPRTFFKLVAAHWVISRRWMPLFRYEWLASLMYSTFGSTSKLYWSVTISIISRNTAHLVSISEWDLLCRLRTMRRPGKQHHRVLTSAWLFAGNISSARNHYLAAASLFSMPFVNQRIYRTLTPTNFAIFNHFFKTGLKADLCIYYTPHFSPVHTKF